MPTLGPDTTVTVSPPVSPVVQTTAPTPGEVVVIPSASPAVQTTAPTSVGVVVVPQPGPPGPPGSGTGVIYTQGSPAATWTVNTSLGRKPYSVNVFDAAGNEIIADVALPSASQIVVTFATPQTGSVSYT